MSNNYHHRFELVTVFEKPAPLRIDRTTCLLHPGECALIFPNQFHHFMDVTPGRFEWLFITFEVRQSAPVRELRNSPRVIDAAAQELLGALMSEYLPPGGAVPDTLSIPIISRGCSCICGGARRSRPSGAICIPATTCAM